MLKKSKSVAQTSQRRVFDRQVVGRIADIDAEGVAWVDFADNPAGAPVEARSILDAPSPATAALEELVGQAVLLFFENDDPALPIICGIVRARFQPKPVTPALTLEASALKDVLVDGRQLVLSAQQQILLRCGKSSVLLRKDGKVVIRGTNVLSRSSGPNKIKGASIDLN